MTGTRCHPQSHAGLPAWLLGHSTRSSSTSSCALLGHSTRSTPTCSTPTSTCLDVLDVPNADVLDVPNADVLDVPNDANLFMLGGLGPLRASRSTPTSS